MDTAKPNIDIQEKYKSNDEISDKIDNKINDEKEIGGFENKIEPTRYGDWEVNGRCSDF